MMQHHSSLTIRSLWALKPSTLFRPKNHREHSAGPGRSGLEANNRCERRQRLREVGNVYGVQVNGCMAYYPLSMCQFAGRALRGKGGAQDTDAELNGVRP